MQGQGQGLTSLTISLAVWIQYTSVMDRQTNGWTPLKSGNAPLSQMS